MPFSFISAIIFKEQALFFHKVDVSFCSYTQTFAHTYTYIQRLSQRSINLLKTGYQRGLSVAVAPRFTVLIFASIPLSFYYHSYF